MKCALISRRFCTVSVAGPGSADARACIYIISTPNVYQYTLQWRHNGQDGVSNHQPHDCLLNRLFKRRSKKSPKLRATGRGPVNSPAQRASNAENVSIWWRRHVVPRQKWGYFQVTCYVYPRYQRSLDRRRLDIYLTYSRRIYQRLSEDLSNLKWISSLRVMRELILGWHGQSSLIWRNVSVLPAERWASLS